VLAERDEALLQRDAAVAQLVRRYAVCLTPIHRCLLSYSLSLNLP
jgi:hypothetical protein